MNYFDSQVKIPQTYHWWFKKHVYEHYTYSVKYDASFYIIILPLHFHSFAQAHADVKTWDEWKTESTIFQLTGAFLSIGLMINFLSLKEMFLISLQGNPILGVSLDTKNVKIKVTDQKNTT